MATISTNTYQLPLSFNQIVELVKQLPLSQKKKLIKTLLPETIDNNEVFEVPEWQKDGVMKRLDDIKQNPNLIINRAELNNRINSFKRK